MYGLGLKLLSNDDRMKNYYIFYIMKVSMNSLPGKKRLHLHKGTLDIKGSLNILGT